MAHSSRRAGAIALAVSVLGLPMALGLVPGLSPASASTSASTPLPLPTWTPAPGVAAMPASGSNVNTFIPTGAMNVRRSGATATLLPDGNVLIAGGGTAAAELYHPGSRTWSSTGSMSTARTDATATMLPDGDVLVAGGCCDPTDPSRGLATAELYDPSTGTWSLTGSMNVPRAGDTATLLGNGDVLVAGGACNGTAYGCDAGSFQINLKSAEIYDPSSGMWNLTGSMNSGREFQSATLLPDGFVLVAGGFNGCDDDFCTDLRTAELYDPVTGTWLHTSSMSAAREQQTATLLTDGDVLVAGGLTEGGDSGFPRTYSSAELYNPVFGTWSETASMNVARAGQTATLLNSGWVLVSGGGSATSEIYEPGPDVWVPTGGLSTVRTDATATLLGSGDVLVAGGAGPGNEPLATAEVFHTGVGPLVSLSEKAIVLSTQEVGTTGNALSFIVTNYGTGPLDVAGVEVSGANPSDFAATAACRAEPVAPGSSCTVLVRFSPVYPGLRKATVGVVDNATLSPQGVAVSGNAAGPYVWVPTGSMTDPRSDFSTTTLADGSILMAGGENSIDESVDTAEIYDPATGSFVPTGPMNEERAFPAAALLPDGSVLVAGGLFFNGFGEESVLASAEIYDPATGIWSPTTPMIAASDGLTATTLANGLVLVTGFGSSPPELYNPSTATWSNTGPMPPGGYGVTALLHNGEVLAAGGQNGVSALYDPTTNTWSATASLATSHDDGTATVLTDGDVLVVGGLGPDGGNPLSSAELYDPTTATWSATASLPAGRSAQSAVLLSNGTVLVAGGCSTSCDNGPVTEQSLLYADGFWSQTGSLPDARIGQSASLLPDGDVLLAGGRVGGGAYATTTAEVYIPPLISATPSPASPGQQITLIGNGFYAHEEVVVTLGGRVVARPDADNHGRFAVPVTLPALHPGTYLLTAQGQTSYAYANGTLVVT
jgi:Kelch motif/Galactose oxidase, central domain